MVPEGTGAGVCSRADGQVKKLLKDNKEGQEGCVLHSLCFSFVELSCYYLTIFFKKKLRGKQYRFRMIWFIISMYVKMYDKTCET